MLHTLNVRCKCYQHTCTDYLLQTGPSYGRKMMTGYLASKGLKVAETRVGRVLRETHRPYHEARQHVRNSAVKYFKKFINSFFKIFTSYNLLYTLLQSY